MIKCLPCCYDLFAGECAKVAGRKRKRKKLDPEGDTQPDASCSHVMLTYFRKRQLKTKLKSKVIPCPDPSHRSTLAAVETIIESFEQTQLDILNLALQSRDGTGSSCVELPAKLKENERSAEHTMVVCKAYRWPNLNSTTAVKKMPFCNSSTVCLNPFHYSLFLDIPFTSFHSLFNFEDSVCQGDESSHMCMDTETETGSNGVYIQQESMSEDIVPSPRSPYPVTTRSRSKTWCSLAYWERRSRVGRLFPVNHSHVDVFDQQAKGEGFCLSAVATNDSDSHKVRRLIGNGVTLALDDIKGEVWLHNRGEYSAFVHSPVLEPLDARTPLIHKLQPGHCAKVYSFSLAERVRAEKRAEQRHRAKTRFDGSSIRISFVKGWGLEYRRQCITLCECWLEVLFNT